MTAPSEDHGTDHAAADAFTFLTAVGNQRQTRAQRQKRRAAALERESWTAAIRHLQALGYDVVGDERRRWSA